MRNNSFTAKTPRNAKEILLVAAMLRRTTNRQILGRLERNFSRVFLGAHASGVHVVAVGSPFARKMRALPGIRAAPGPCGEVFGCGSAAPWLFVRVALLPPLPQDRGET